MPATATCCPTIGAGRVDVPVVGVTDKAAAAVLGLPEDLPATVEGVEPPESVSDTPLGTGGPSRFASVGPAYDGAVKPDISRRGSIVAAGNLVSGAAVAAVYAAAEAAENRQPVEEARTRLLAGTDTRPTAPRSNRRRSPSAGSMSTASTAPTP